eukprot:1193551-Alexandrium_andersonii.AAC.1
MAPQTRPFAGAGAAREPPSMPFNIATRVPQRRPGQEPSAGSRCAETRLAASHGGALWSARGATW